MGTLAGLADSEMILLSVYDCRTHDLKNLYVVDASFMPRSGAINPSLTIAANALRVAPQIAPRLSNIAAQ
jgi:choline dehydrogenase-like flavoprotein